MTARTTTFRFKNQDRTALERVMTALHARSARSAFIRTLRRISMSDEATLFWNGSEQKVDDSIGEFKLCISLSEEHFEMLDIIRRKFNLDTRSDAARYAVRIMAEALKKKP